MSILYIMRHGESEANVNANVYDQKHNWDIELTQRGRRQAQRAGDWLKEDIHRLASKQIICSPYLRTKKTAEIIRKKLDISEYRTNMLLAEWNPGEQEGATHISEFGHRPVEKHFNAKLGRLHYKPHRAESFLDMHVRAGVFVFQQNSFEEFENQYTIIVTHMSFALAFHHYLLQTISTDSQEQWKTCEIRKYYITAGKFEQAEIR